MTRKKVTADTPDCSVTGCGKKAQSSRGWCNAHHLRWRRHGDPLGGASAHASPGALKAWIIEHAGHSSDECLIWPFSRSPSGYPNSMGFGDQVTPAHRVMCTVAHGEPPTATHHAAHSCGNGRGGCISPRHLRWATPLENAADKTAHGTTVRGEAVGGAKVSESTVLEIYALRGGGQRTVAKQFGVTRKIVRAIWRGDTWAWLTGEKPSA